MVVGGPERAIGGVVLPSPFPVFCSCWCMCVICALCRRVNRSITLAQIIDACRNVCTGPLAPPPVPAASTPAAAPGASVPAAGPSSLSSSSSSATASGGAAPIPIARRSVLHRSLWRHYTHRYSLTHPNFDLPTGGVLLHDNPLYVLAA
jgi:hypothetical protein